MLEIFRVARFLDRRVKWMVGFADENFLFPPRKYLSWYPAKGNSEISPR